MNPALLTAILGATGALYVMMERYRPTTHGDNPWALDGFIRMLLISPYIDRILAIGPARLTSGWRAPEIAAAIYRTKDPEVVAALAKARGVSVQEFVASVTTVGRHLRGLAGDFVPVSGTIDELAQRIFDHSVAGSLGPVRTVLHERDHVHVEWGAPGEAPKSLGSTYQRV